MGTILSSRSKDDNNIIFEISLSYSEALQLKGHMSNVYLFAEDVSGIKTGLAQRGKNDTTKYFLMPREFRKNVILTNSVSCQRLETKDKMFFIYTMDKY